MRQRESRDRSDQLLPSDDDQEQSQHEQQVVDPEENVLDADGLPGIVTRGFPFLLP